MNMKRKTIIVFITGFSIFILNIISSSVYGAPAAMTRDEIICLAQSGVGFSYWWGHGAWCASGCARDRSCGAGSCSGSCPDCTHSGSYGADCSGFVAKVWQVPSPINLSTDSHPYSTQDFRCSEIHWTQISKNNIQKADALVYRSGGCPGSSGHVMIYESGDPWGSSWTYEARGCSYGIVHNNRTVSSEYVAIRRNNLTASCTPSTEVCDGKDNDCDNEVDEDYVPHTCGTGECERQSTCSGGVENCVPGSPSPEICDGKDNDCDGDIDEDLAPFTCGEGECKRQGICQNGAPNCVPGEPSPEICDGLDNDCDGQVDEDGVCNFDIPTEPVESDANITFPDVPEREDTISTHDSSTLETSDSHPAWGYSMEGGCGCSLVR